MLLNIDNFVIANKQIGSVVKNSVGIVKAINGESAMVLFIGVNEIKKVNFDNLESIDIYKTGKGFDCKICNICHILKLIKPMQRVTKPLDQVVESVENILMA